jgi:2-isopropylmalate synthase
VRDQAGRFNSLWKASGLHVTCVDGNVGHSHCYREVRSPDSVQNYVAATPVDVVYYAIDQLIGLSIELDSYEMGSVNHGRN